MVIIESHTRAKMADGEHIDMPGEEAGSRNFGAYIGAIISIGVL